MKKCPAFILNVERSHASSPPQSLEVKVVCSFETSGIDNPATEHNPKYVPALGTLLLPTLCLLSISALDIV
jgi:hypothetical protein